MTDAELVKALMCHFKYGCSSCADGECAECEYAHEARENDLVPSLYKAAADRIKLLSESLNGVSNTAIERWKENRKLQRELAAVKRERDAAVAEICEVCKDRYLIGGGEMLCSECERRSVKKEDNQ